MTAIELAQTIASSGLVAGDALSGLVEAARGLGVCLGVA